MFIMESSSAFRKYQGFFLHLRKVNTILASCVIAVAFGIVITFVQTAFSLFSHQSRTTKFTPYSPYFSQPQPANPPNANSQRKVSNNLVLVFDFWERMINIQSGLRRLVNLGIDSDFTVVEPFVFESKVSPQFSLPEQFEAEKMKPQPASYYFRTEDLKYTNRFITFDQWQERGRHNASILIIDAALFFDWDGTREPPSEPFQKCDDKLNALPRSIYGHALSDTTHILSAICLQPRNITTPHFFKSLFAQLRERKISITKCKTCTVSIALMNYRKHAFNPFISYAGSKPFLQKVPPLPISHLATEMASRIRKEIIGNRKYVAIHLRTGKAFVLFSQHGKASGNNTHVEYGAWLDRCTDNLIRVAKSYKQSAYYIASDMYHDGWKGGEVASPMIESLLERTRQKFEGELGVLHKFNAKHLDIDQDIMGMSGVVDAAVSVEADIFLHAIPSNFGTWVGEQRLFSGKDRGVQVSCWDKRLQETSPF